MQKCAICMKRKGKRYCQALQKNICAQCCGSSRLKRIQCPANCVYLQLARTVEIERREKELQKRSAVSSRLELEISSFPIREAIVSYTTMRADVTDEDVVAVLEALEHAVHSEMAQGVKVTPNLPEHLMPLAKAISDNVATMRGELNFPHNAALMRALRAMRQEADGIMRRSDDRRSFIRALRASVKPHSLGEFIARLKGGSSEDVGRRIVLPR